MDGVADSLSIAGGSSVLDRDPADYPFLGGLPEDVRGRLLRAARVEELAPRTDLFAGGEIPAHLHIILSGILELACFYEGRECTALMMSAGDVLMPAAVLYSEPFLISARSLTETQILSIDANVLRHEARTSTDLALALARLMGGQWRVALKIILDLKCRSPSQRLAAFLLRLHDGSDKGSPAEVPFSKRQLASRIGMQPETLSRTLQILAANGLYLRGRQIIVTDRDAAETFCGADPYPPASDDDLGVHAL